jgi:hypothetical protein
MSQLLGGFWIALCSGLFSLVGLFYNDEDLICLICGKEWTQGRGYILSNYCKRILV